MADVNLEKPDISINTLINTDIWQDEETDLLAIQTGMDAADRQLQMMETGYLHRNEENVTGFFKKTVDPEALRHCEEFGIQYAAVALSGKQSTILQLSSGTGIIGSAGFVPAVLMGVDPIRSLSIFGIAFLCSVCLVTRNNRL